MIDEKTKKLLNETGVELAKDLSGFYGKVVFNFYNGNYVSFNVELTVKKDNLYERNKNV
ncbi:hypothetical protein LCGC14_1841540 [marine sediment metagenome]|uniref:Uncharacterized protein n=1 Tax=marine sediment metagenome TaxID=412755 RepID=A0A0F9JCG8_9ZZZZ